MPRTPGYDAGQMETAGIWREMEMSQEDTWYCGHQEMMLQQGGRWLACQGGWRCSRRAKNIQKQ